MDKTYALSFFLPLFLLFSFLLFFLSLPRISSSALQTPIHKTSHLQPAMMRLSLIVMGSAPMPMVFYIITI